MKKQGNGRISIIVQVATLFVLCIMLTGFITFVSQLIRSNHSVNAQKSDRAKELSKEVDSALREYPSHEWLINYWYEHADELDIEYDVDYSSGTETENKRRLLEKHQPGLQLKYADEEELASLPEEDQKLSAEIIYSWLITRVNQIKRANNLDFLFCVSSEEPYDTQVFIFSAADEGAVRGTEGLEVYPLGFIKETTDRQQTAMRDSVEDLSYFTTANGYVDYYAYFEKIGGRDILLGMTYAETAIADEVFLQTTKGSLAAMGYQIILALICSGGIYFIVLKPLKKVQGSIRLYKNTKNSAAVTADLEKFAMKNEIGDLAADIIDLSREMDEYHEQIKKITADQERISAELALAEQIQNSMLPQEFPPFPDRTEFDIFAVMDPAREVGGDFYDFFLIDDDHLCLVIADVSGKGIPAALFMMMGSLVIRSFAMMNLPVSDILATVNDTLCANNSAEMFITAWVGILEISTGKLKAANAGHEYPAVRRPDGQFELLKDKHGFVLGSIEGMKYHEYELQMEPGSNLFVYTDGVPEAMDSDDRLFGTDRMIDALNAEPAAEPEQILDNVKKAVDGFVGDAEQFDDLTMLSIIYMG